MAQIIDLNERRIKKNFDRNADPCSSCSEKNRIKNCPCEEADIWWNIAAGLLKEGKL